MGYRRRNGRVGTRNEVWILNTVGCVNHAAEQIGRTGAARFAGRIDGDRKSTRLNSSHGYISYAVFCLKKKKKDQPAAVAAAFGGGDAEMEHGRGQRRTHAHG